jgi:hypothetical protein
MGKDAQRGWRLTPGIRVAQMLRMLRVRLLYYTASPFCPAPGPAPRPS